MAMKSTDAIAAGLNHPATGLGEYCSSIPPSEKARPDSALTVAVRQAVAPYRFESVSGAMERFFTRVATAISSASGQPMAFVLATTVILVWGITGPVFHFSDTWQLVVNTGTTIVTFLMVFLIQNAQNRDAAAMQAKLDELLRSVGKARDQFIGVEHLTEREIEMIRRALEREAKNSERKHGTAKGTVDRLLDRF
jgi:low affinity Fe/Cu permease